MTKNTPPGAGLDDAALAQGVDRACVIAQFAQHGFSIGAQLGREIEKLLAQGRTPVVLCGPQVRAQVKKIADTVQPGIVVLSYNEIVRDVKVESVGMVGLEAAAA